MVSQLNNALKILRMKQVTERTGICRALVYRYIREGKFPSSIRLGERAVGWYEHDIDAWLSSRISNAPIGKLGGQK
jgi:prophage regulatory protein